MTMARDRITAIVLRENELEWTTISARGGGKVDGHHRRDLVPPPEADAAPEAAEAGEAAEGEALSLPDQIKAECGHVKDHTLVGGLATEQMLLRVIDLPATDAGELEGMVALQVDKFSPFPVDRMVVSHEVLRREEETSLVLIAAVQKEVADGYGDVLRQAGMHPDHVDAVIMGWWRLLADADRIAAAGRQAFVLLEGVARELIVVQDGAPILFRSLPGLDEGSVEEAAGELAREVAHSLMSLELEHGGGASTRVYLYCRGEASPELVTALETECEGPVEVDVLDRLPPVSEGLARRATARDERQRLDLTPLSWRETEAAAHFKKRMIFYSSLALVVWVLGLAALLGGLAYERRNLSALQRSFAALHAQAEEVDAMRKRVFVVEQYVDVESSALEALRAISQVQPGGIDLNSFSYRKGEGVRIGGEANGVNEVYAFKNRLDESGVFTESELFGPRRDARRRKDIFEIVLRVPGGEE